ncbi:MAG: VWA domain-containing protein [Acidobacteria bacterium]|nr:VWA domain-containing protein [Acidobacteriota bacterium]
MPSEAGFAPVEAKSGEPVRLAMQQLYLTGRVLPVGARLVVRHTFVSAETKPVEVVYSFGLPRDAALRSFRITGEGFDVHSELKPVAEATSAYEAGLEKGHLAALARQYRDGVVNLSVGNLRPEDSVTVWLEILAGVELRDDGLRFRFPFTLAPCYHPEARASDGEIELPQEQFGDMLLPRWRREAAGLHEVVFDLTVEMGAEIVEIGSPSHATRVQANRVTLAPAADVPNRDLVLDARMRANGPRVLAGKGEDGRGHFAAVAPSTSFGAPRETPRTVVLLLDRSGSMAGVPLEQARKAVLACLAALGVEDRFGLVAFDDQTELFRPQLAPATPQSREEAKRFLHGIDARGGTQLAAGVNAAARLFGESGGDIFVLTDGQVLATESILEQARKTGFRIHSLGIGSASQDRFLALLARETGGVSRFVTPRERVDLAAVDLFASASRPLATGLRASTARLPGGAVAPDPPAVLFGGAPLLVFGECDAEGGMLELEWAEGRLEIPVSCTAGEAGESVRLLQGSRLITDAESRVAGGRREVERMEKYLESLSLRYGLASRRMALVAVVERAADRPGEPPRTQVVPVGMPEDVRYGAYFGSVTRAAPVPDAASPRMMYAMPASFGGGLKRLFRAEAKVEGRAEPQVETTEDLLVELAGKLEPDGGMPGRSPSERVAATTIALLLFLAEGHTEKSGAFRIHVQRMLKFLGSGVLDKLPAEQRERCARVIAGVRAGKPPDGDWPAAARAVMGGGRRAASDAWARLA